MSLIHLHFNLLLYLFQQQSLIVTPSFFGH